MARDADQYATNTLAYAYANSLAGKQECLRYD